MNQRSMIDRMKGAAMLDVATYEEVEHDPEATLQAAGVVTLVAVASALGSWQLGPVAIAWGAVSALLSWGLWAGVTYVVGDKLFGGTATWGELLRTLGFAQAPGVLAILIIIPLVGWVFALVMFVWMLATAVVAIRQALDFSTGKAVLTGLIGLVCVVALRMMVALFTGL